MMGEGQFLRFRTILYLLSMHMGGSEQGVIVKDIPLKPDA